MGNRPSTTAVPGGGARDVLLIAKDRKFKSREDPNRFSFVPEDCQSKHASCANYQASNMSKHRGTGFDAAVMLTGKLAVEEASEAGWSLREATTAALKENQAAAETAAAAGGSFERVAAAADTISRASAVAAGMSREEAAETAAGLAGKLAADRALATVQSSEEAAAAAGRAALKYWFSCCNSKCRPGCGRSNICSRQATSRNSS